MQRTATKPLAMQHLVRWKFFSTFIGQTLGTRSIEFSIFNLLLTLLCYRSTAFWEECPLAIVDDITAQSKELLSIIISVMVQAKYVPNALIITYYPWSRNGVSCLWFVKWFDSAVHYSLRVHTPRVLNTWTSQFIFVVSHRTSLIGMDSAVSGLFRFTYIQCCMQWSFRSVFFIREPICCAKLEKYYLRRSTERVVCIFHIPWKEQRLTVFLISTATVVRITVLRYGNVATLETGSCSTWPSPTFQRTSWPPRSFRFLGHRMGTPHIFLVVSTSGRRAHCLYQTGFEAGA